MSILRCKYDVESVPDDVSYTDFVLRNVQDYGDRIALIDDKTGEKVTYSDLNTKINALTQALNERGLQKGDVVCLYADKSIIGIITVFVILKIGAVMTPCRPFHKARELAIQLNDSKSSVIISDHILMPNAIQAAKDAPSVQKLYSIGSMDGYESLENMMTNTVVQKTIPNPQINTKEDAALIVYSSGTTGLPKGVMLTHYAMVAATCIYSDPHLKLLTGEVYFHFAPPFHLGGLAVMSLYLYAKKTLLLYTPLSLIPFLQKAKEHKITSIPMGPNYLTEISKLPAEELKKLHMDFSNVVINTGGSVIGAGITQEVLTRVGVKAVVQGYGCTECCAAGTIDYEDNFVPGSAGVVLPHTQIKIVDIHSGITLAVHQKGEVCIKGPHLMRGYLNNPEATEKAIDKDGWLHTGDLGYYDESEHLFIVDRIKDVIKYQTMQISPAEIEEVIFTHQAVQSVCVVGVEDDENGEIPLACVIVKDGHSVTEEEIVQLVKGNLADYKQLRGGVKFVKKFPLNSMGKIVRKELKEQIGQ